MNEIERADLVGSALRVTSAALRNWMNQKIASWPPDRNGQVEPRDPSYLIWVALNFRPAGIPQQLGRDGLHLLHDLRHLRNRWAHHIPFDDLDTVRALDTCRRILVAVGSREAAETVEAQARRVLGAAHISEPTQVPAVAAPASPPEPKVHRTTITHRRMREPEFRRYQWDHRFDPHVAPINQLVDDLIEERDGSWMPYIPPYHGGIQSKTLLIYQDPGTMTSTDFGGSGFLGCENDDPSAQVVAECLDAAGIDPMDVMSWNAYPWFLPEQGGLTTKLIDTGVEPLRRLLELLPELRTVVTGGAKAHESWRRLEQRHPDVTVSLCHLKTFHASGRGITNGGQQTKAEGLAHVVATFTEAAAQSR